jgi:hypothetical protein
MLDTKLAETSFGVILSERNKYGTPQTLASCLISLFLVCFRFHVFSELAILYLRPLVRRVHPILCLPGGQGRRYEPIAAV